MDNKNNLKSKLSGVQYQVTQECGTEPPFMNEYWNNKKPGIYVDIVSGELLFTSLDKFDSGTGWPSFTKPAEKKNIYTKEDTSGGMTRLEVRSKTADSHLGHLFTDGPAPENTRFCINSAALRFIPVENLDKEGYGRYLPLFNNEIETAVFAGGCFWGMEHILQEIKGVISTSAGYTGGVTENPDYENVSEGRTGHAEAVEIRFNKKVISYKDLLDYFWRMHDPTTLNRQGADRGTQYRSAIFYLNKEQKENAEESMKRFNKITSLKRKAVTDISPFKIFYKAEEYHQDYYKKNPLRPVCHIIRKEF